MGHSEATSERKTGGYIRSREARETEAFVWKIRRGAVVIVFGVLTLEAVRKLLPMRGADFARSVRVRCCYREADVRAALAGIDRPVDIHPAFWTQANEDAARVALELAERANARASA